MEWPDSSRQIARPPITSGNIEAWNPPAYSAKQALEISEVVVFAYPTSPALGADPSAQTPTDESLTLDYSPILRTCVYY